MVRIASKTFFWVGAVALLGLGITLLLMGAFSAAPSTFYTQAPQTFTTDTRYVTADLFTWFSARGGQRVANWTPREGRSAWDGGVHYWKDQLKQIMSANIDTLYVHSLGNEFRDSRCNLFIAMRHLRKQGYDVPKVAPWSDYSGFRRLDVSTAAGKDAFVNSYKDFFDDYYTYNTDVAADDYIHCVDGKVVLNLWEARSNLTNHSALIRADVESRLRSSYGAAHPMFNNGIYMTSVVYTDPNITFLDEMIPQHQDTRHLVYYYPGNTNQYDGGNHPYYKGYKTASIKPGFWNQNYRSPASGGKFLARDGGIHYTNAWDTAIADRATLKHVKIESWNEYSEGSGIFPANLTPVRDRDVTAKDTWSETNDPLQYVKTTAEGARQFNDNPDRNATILYQDFPSTMRPGQVLTVQVVVRNTGDLAWKNSTGFKFGEFGERFSPNSLIDDASPGVTTYGGIFRGAPYTFTLTLTAPNTPGVYTTKWSMLDSLGFFGDSITANITVATESSDRLIGGIAIGGIALAGLVGISMRRRKRS